jgi:dipeptidyl aminopeptidase/acylaminoacyl peptidase
MLNRFWFVLLLGLSVQAVLVHAEDKIEDEPIPIYDLMKNPKISSVKISPDGKAIVALFDVDDRSMVMVKQLDSDNPPHIIDVYNNDVQWVQWANNKRIIAGTTIERGEWRDTYEYVVMDDNGNNMRYLTTKDQPGRIINMLPNDPEHILMEVWTRPVSFQTLLEFGGVRSGNRMGLNKVSVNKRKPLRRIEMRYFSRWIVDKEGSPKIGVRFFPKKSVIKVKDSDGDWETIREIKYFKDPVFIPVAVDMNNIAYVLSRHENDKAGLYEFNLDTLKFGKLLFQHDLVDVGGIFFHQLTGEFEDVGGVHLSQLTDELEYASFTLNKTERFYFDENLKKESLSLNQALKGIPYKIVSRSLDEKKMIILAQGDDYSGSYFLYNRESKAINFIAHKHPELIGRSMSKTKGISYLARDGMTLYGFISMPDLVDEKPVPLVVLVHGGPFARDNSRFDVWVQFLTSRGYAVFQPNFRGSTGYGSEYERKGYKQWGLAMQDDIVDGVMQLVEKKFIDKNRICIMGASYGGYAALMGVVKTPDLYRCAISYAGISDINALLAGIGFSSVNSALIGGDLGLRSESSAINFVDKIKASVFLAHGTEDNVVNFNQSKRMYKKLKSAGKKVTYLEFDDENHYLEEVKNRVELFEQIEVFLEENLAK